MPRRRDREIIRQFPENGLKLLLERPENVRDLLNVAAREIADRIDFDEMRCEKTTQELGNMVRSMADVVSERAEKIGVLKGRRQLLLMQLRSRFDDLPASTVQAVESTVDTEQLDEWAERILTAQTLDDMGID